MLVQGIKSRPVYKGVRSTPTPPATSSSSKAKGRWPCLNNRPRSATDILAKTEILYVAAGSKPKDHGRKLASLGASDYWEAPSIPVLAQPSAT